MMDCLHAVYNLVHLGDVSVRDGWGAPRLYRGPEVLANKLFHEKKHRSRDPFESSRAKSRDLGPTGGGEIPRQARDDGYRVSHVSMPTSHRGPARKFPRDDTDSYRSLVPLALDVSNR